MLNLREATRSRAQMTKGYTMESYGCFLQCLVLRCGKLWLFSPVPRATRRATKN